MSGESRVNTGDSAYFYKPPNRPDGLPFLAWQFSLVQSSGPALKIRLKLYSGQG